MVNNSVNEIAQVLLGAKQSVIVSHYHPDADAYGASCALGLALKSLGQTVTLLNESGADPRYLFIAGVAEVQKSCPANPEMLLIACDCGEPKRVGDSLTPVLQKARCVVNIDHHFSNEGFGHYNLVDGRRSSASELVFEVLSEMPVKISPQMASALFAGIMGDTGSFRYASTSARTLYVAQQLVQAGARPEVISQELYGQNSLAAVRLHGEALAGLRLHFDQQVCELVVTEEILERCQAAPSDTEHLVEKGRDIRGVCMAFLAYWDHNHWHVSLRSRSAEQDVARVAQHFGGGGHKNAAAFRWRGSYEDLRPALLAELGKLTASSPAA